MTNAISTRECLNVLDDSYSNKNLRSNSMNLTIS